MKKLQLENFGVQEMDAKEMTETIGGSWFSRAIDAIGNALDDAYHWAQDNLGLKLGSDGPHGR